MKSQPVRIVAGCPIANRAWAVHDWAKHLRENLPEDSKLVAVVTPSQDETREALCDEGVIVVDGPGWSRPIHQIDTHIWTTADYRYMALVRNLLAQQAWQMKATWFASVDSDIRANSSVAALVERALEAKVDAIAPMINLQMKPGRPPAWNFMRRLDHHYERSLEVTTPTMAVDAIMAAMVISRGMWLVPWSEHPQGEDLGWATNAHAGVRKFKLALATDIEWEHVMDKPCLA